MRGTANVAGVLMQPPLRPRHLVLLVILLPLAALDPGVCDPTTGVGDRI